MKSSSCDRALLPQGEKAGWLVQNRGASDPSNIKAVGRAKIVKSPAARCSRKKYYVIMLHKSSRRDMATRRNGCNVHENKVDETLSDLILHVESFSGVYRG